MASPSLSAVLATLRSLLLSVMTVEVVRGQVNRVPEPAASDFVVMWPISMVRLETNVDDYMDVSFAGSISGASLTVTTVAYGVLSIGQTVYDTTGAVGTIAALGTGTGGPGTYVLAAGATAASGQLWAGAATLTMPSQFTVQMDIHGPNSADNAFTVANIMRDRLSTEFFSKSGIDAQILYASEPTQIPFENAEKQYEDRWIIDVSIQVNSALVQPQQFADELQPTTIDVNAAYPA